MISSKLLLLLCTLLCVVSAELINSKVTRNIDLTSQLARHTISITVENKGSSSEQQYVLPVLNADKLAFFSATQEDVVLKVSKGAVSTQNDQSYTPYTVNFANGLAGGQSVTLDVVIVYAHSIEPYPAQIAQNERQLVRYFDNHYFFSPYTTTTQTTTAKLSSHVVENYSTVNPTKQNKDSMTYGAYTNVAPYSYKQLRVHYENNTPFITITQMTKEYEVSHWGNVAVEQALYIRHDGAKLKGHFSRFDFQRNPGASPAAVLSLTEVLPVGAADVYYRDDIGNISSSAFAISTKGLELQLTPRFPLFGGWKNNFYMGYNLPLENALFHDQADSSSFVLNVTFASDFGNFVIDDYTVKIILPEGAKNAKVVAPFDVSTTQDKHFTYLDTTGRTVLIIKKTNVVPDHNQFFQIEYEYAFLSMLHEPLLIAGAFLALFLTIMFFVRFRLSISAPVDTTKLGEKQREISAAIKQLTDKINADVVKMTNVSQSAADYEAYNRQRPQTTRDLLTQLSNQINQALKVSDDFQNRVRTYYQAQADRLESLLELHELSINARTGTGKKKSKFEQEKQSIQSVIDGALDHIQDFADEYLN